MMLMRGAPAKSRTGGFWWWLTIVEGDYRMAYIGVPDSVPDVEFSR